MTIYVDKSHSTSGEEVRFLGERLVGNQSEVKSIMAGKKTPAPSSRQNLGSLPMSSMLV
jgi:hypothetical protein